MLNSQVVYLHRHNFLLLLSFLGQNIGGGARRGQLVAEDQALTTNELGLGG